VSVQEQQGTAARRAARDLVAAVEGLARVFPPSVDGVDDEGADDEGADDEGADDEGAGPRRR